MQKLSMLCAVLLIAAESPASLWRCRQIVPRQWQYSHMGNALSVSGDYLASAGLDGVQVYHREQGHWLLKQLIPRPESLPDHLFGASVSLSGDVCIIGALTENPESEDGYVFVYRLRNGQWIHKETITNPDAWPYYWPVTVSVDGNVCGITGPASEYTPLVNLYRFDGQEWQLETVKDGVDVKVHDNLCAVLKTTRDHYLWTVDICRFDGADWTVEKELTFSYVFAFDFDGSHLAVIVPDDSTDPAGTALCLYARDHGDWVLQAKLPVSDGGESYFGEEVAVGDAFCVVRSMDPAGEQLFIYDYSEQAWGLTTRLRYPLNGWVPDISHFFRGLTCDGHTIFANAMGASFRFVIATFEKCPTADLTGDCRVTEADLQAVAEQWLAGKRGANTP